MSRDALPRDNINRVLAGTMLAVVLFHVVAGCTGPASSRERREERQFSVAPRTTPHPSPTPPETRKLQPEQITIGKSVAGRPVTAEFYGNGAQPVLVIATIHGNETAGTPLVRKLGEYLLENPELMAAQPVIIVPVANPDGMAANRRANERGVDLNRNFPAWNYNATRNHGGTPLSEPESRALHDLIVKHSPKRIISIHQPLACIDYDGPADGVARAMASSSRLPLKRLGSLAGSLGSFVGITRKTPIVTVEFARSADNLSPDALWERYGRMLLVGICYPDSVPALAGDIGANPGASVSDKALTEPSRATLGN